MPWWRLGRTLLMSALVGVAAPAPGQDTGLSEAPASIDVAEASDLATHSLLLDAVSAGDRIVAVGHFGHVLLSDDGGGTWRQAERVDTRVTLTEVSFANEQQGWAVGHDAVILHTADAGETWRLQHRDPSLEVPLLSVSFRDEHHGRAVGGFGLLLETRDGGQTWTRRAVSDDPDEEFHLNHLFEGPDETVFIAAEAGTVYRSRGQGSAWERLTLPYSGSFWSGSALPDGSVLVVGMRGHAFRSADLGESWEPVATGTDQSISDLALLEDGSLVAVGLGGAVLRSADGGRSFTSTTEPDRKGFASVEEGSGGSLLVFGEAGVRRIEPAESGRSN